jgi:glycosyltransferase involved in cell wall biosynthesis
VTATERLGQLELPTVSVVVPAFRHSNRLRACLTALAAQDHPTDRLEVVVVDDGSPTPLAPALESFTDRLRLRLHRQPNAGPAVARNTGARLASGEILAFTDDDCTPARDWARQLSLAVRGRPDALVGGRVENTLLSDRFAEASQQLIDFLYDWYGADREGRFFVSENLAASREAFLQSGGFDGSFPRPGAEDRELCERWTRAGQPLVFEPAAVVGHAHPMGLVAFVRQHRNYGRGAFQLRRRRRAAGETRMQLEPLRFYTRLVTYPFGRRRRRAALAQSALLVLSQAANAAGFLEEGLRHRS